MSLEKSQKSGKGLIVKNDSKKGVKNWIKSDHFQLLIKEGVDNVRESCVSSCLYESLGISIVTPYK